jgi:hypothetical protein
MNWTKEQTRDLNLFKQGFVVQAGLEQKYGLPVAMAMVQSASCVRECGRLARPNEDDCQPCADELTRQQADDATPTYFDLMGYDDTAWASWGNSLQT